MQPAAASYPADMDMPELSSSWGSVDPSYLWAEDCAPATISPTLLLNQPSADQEWTFASAPEQQQHHQQQAVQSQEPTPIDLVTSAPLSPAGTPPAQPPSALAAPAPAASTPTNAMELLMQLIAWPAGGARSVQAVKKRPRTTDCEYSKEKHLLTEKRRREDMSEAIDTIHRIMPESPMDKKLTKVDILQDAALYFARLQAVALALVEENARLRALFNTHGASQH